MSRRNNKAVTPPPFKGAGPRLTLTVTPAARLFLAGLPPALAIGLADMESPLLIEICDPKDER